MVDQFHDLSVSVGKYYTSLSKSLFTTNYCCINKKNIFIQYDTNELNVSDISQKSVMAASPSSLLLFTYDATGSYQIEAVNFEAWSSNYISRIFN